MTMDFTLFSDVADALEINEPAFVEKDYYAVQLLKLVNDIQFGDYNIIFSGGTCLSKAYQNTERMSEDIDIKFVEREPGKKKKSHRKLLGNTILKKITDSPDFNIINEHYRDTRRVQTFGVEYPKNFSTPSLRPTLQLELVEKELYQPTRNFPISSMYAEVMGKPSEINTIACVNMESIIAEKIISLLWRTSALANGIEIKDDEALIRHMYDIHLLNTNKKNEIDYKLLKNIATKVIEMDAKRYQEKYPLFQKNPSKLLIHGLDEIRSNPSHRDRYEQFLLPLVYAKTPPSWKQALKSLETLFSELFLV